MTKFTLRSLIGLLAFVAALHGEEPPGKTRTPGVRELADLLDQVIDPGALQKPVSLKEALALLKKQVAARNRELPIIVDTEAFKEENPDAPSIYDAQVQFPPFPRSMTLAKALRMILARVNPPNATYLVHPGYLEITTFERASVAFQLGQRVRIRFQRRPLADALEDLYELTGVAVVLDTRAGRLAHIPITANFTNDVSLGTALLLLSEMAGLKLLTSDEILYIATPAHAREFLLERAANPYRLPPFSSRSGAKRAIEAE